MLANLVARVAKEYPVLSKKEVAELCDKKDYDSIVLHNIRLVPKVVNGFLKPEHSMYEDCVSEGIIGLRTAAERFEPERGFTFSTYSRNWIKQKAMLFYQRNTGPVRVPASTQTNKSIRTARIVAERIRNLTYDGITKVTYEDVAEESGISYRGWMTLIQAMPQQISLSGTEEASLSGMTAMELLAGEYTPNPAVELETDDLMRVLYLLLAELPPRSQEVVTRRYFQGQTLEEVSEVIGTSRERVRQIEEEILKKLKRELKELGFDKPNEPRKGVRLCPIE